MLLPRSIWNMNKADSDWLAAYVWLKARRRHAPPNADVWHLRFHWPQQGEALYQQVCSGNYHLQPMQLHRYHDSRWVQWCAQDALVLKWVALQVESGCRCTSVAPISKAGAGEGSR